MNVKFWATWNTNSEGPPTVLWMKIKDSFGRSFDDMDEMLKVLKQEIKENLKIKDK
jgi:hypothetical protein